jgi:hypothetical protein
MEETGRLFAPAVATAAEDPSGTLIQHLEPKLKVGIIAGSRTLQTITVQLPERLEEPSPHFITGATAAGLLTYRKCCFAAI